MPIREKRPERFGGTGSGTIRGECFKIRVAPGPILFIRLPCMVPVLSLRLC